MTRPAICKQTTILLAVTLLVTATRAIPLAGADDNEDLKRLEVDRQLLGQGEQQLGSVSGLHKRYPFAIQSRSGGMSLCLWKVCPAAPWLVNKRHSPDTGATWRDSKASSGQIDAPWFVKERDSPDDGAWFVKPNTADY